MSDTEKKENGSFEDERLSTEENKKISEALSEIERNIEEDDEEITKEE